MSLEYTWYSYDSKREKKNIYILFLKKKKKKKNLAYCPRLWEKIEFKKEREKVMGYEVVIIICIYIFGLREENEKAGHDIKARMEVWSIIIYVCQDKST